MTEGKVRRESPSIHASATPCSFRDLENVEWLQLAVLMLGPALVTNPHIAPVLPLCAPLPSRSVRLQRLLTEQCYRLSGKGRLINDFTHVCRNDSSRLKLAHLGRMVQLGPNRIDTPEECWDVWLQPAVMLALV